MLSVVCCRENERRETFSLLCSCLRLLLLEQKEQPTERARDSERREGGMEQEIIRSSVSRLNEHREERRGEAFAERE